jgi:hypothetical protein
MNTNTHQRLTWDEIVARYPNQWVFILEPEPDASAGIRSGIVLKHDPDKHHLYRRINAEAPVSGTTTVTYTGVLSHPNHAWRAFTVLTDPLPTT